MKAQLLNEQPKTFAVILDSGDEAMEQLTTFAQEKKLSAAQITAIGAFQEVTLGFFDFEVMDYREIPLNEQVEVLSFLGDVALDDEKPKLHVHVVVGKRDGSAAGGHLLRARVRPTLEVIITESPAHLRRKTDPKTGLALIRPGD